MNQSLETFLEELVDEGYFSANHLQQFVQAELMPQVGGIATQISGSIWGFIDQLSYLATAARPTASPSDVAEAERRVSFDGLKASDVRRALKIWIASEGIDSVSDAVAFLETYGISCHQVAADLGLRGEYDIGIDKMLTETGRDRPLDPFEGFGADRVKITIYNPDGTIQRAGIDGSAFGVGKDGAIPIITIGDDVLATLGVGYDEAGNITGWTRAAVSIDIPGGVARNSDGEDLFPSGVTIPVGEAILTSSAYRNMEGMSDAILRASGQIPEGSSAGDVEEQTDLFEAQGVLNEGNYLIQPADWGPDYLVPQGVPAGAVGVKIAVDEQGRRVLPGDDRTVAGYEFVDFMWQPGDQDLFFSGWSKEAVGFMQQVMEDAGLLRAGEYDPGEWDMASKEVMAQVMAEANNRALVSASGIGLEALTEQRPGQAAIPVSGLENHTAVAGLLETIGQMAKQLPNVPEYTPPPMRVPSNATLTQIIENEYVSRIGRKPTAEEMAGWIRHLDRNYRISGRDLQLEAEREWIRSYVEQGYMPTAQQQALLDSQQSMVRDVDPVAAFQQAFSTAEAGMMSLNTERESLRSMKESILGSVFAGKQGVT